jgi:hypothetical protein
LGFARGVVQAAPDRPGKNRRLRQYARTGAGAPHIDIVPDSTRSFAITDCGSMSCRLSVPNGVVVAGEGKAAMDVGSQMLTNSQMLINYPSGPDYYRTTVLLSGLQARVRQLAFAAPAP